MRKLIIFADGSQALTNGIQIEGQSAVVESIDLDSLPAAVREDVIANRRKATPVHDKQGKLKHLKVGKRVIAV